jgi:hypothetical protein
MSDQSKTNQNFEDRILALEKGQQEILNALQPITEVFNTIKKGGKWFAAIVVFLSAVVTLIAGSQGFIREIINKILK